MHKHKRTHKEAFNVYMDQILLIGSIYRKDGNCYPKLFLEKYYFVKDIKMFGSNFDKKYFDEKCIIIFRNS